MGSGLAEALALRFQPIAVIFSDERPEGALMLKEGVRACVMGLITDAAKGRTVAFDRKTVRCGGGGAGLGFGNTYANMPGFEYFLSTGGHGYGEGEAYKKTPELAKSVMDHLPATDIPYSYVVMKPLRDVTEAEKQPELVIFYANPDQLSALVVLANYGRPSNDNVVVRMSSGCQSVCLIPYQLGREQPPKAVIGITDITARPYVDPDVLGFTVPWEMYLEMEGNVAGSFLDRPDWRKVRERIIRSGGSSQ